MAENTRFEIARQQIEFARSYTLGLVADIADEDWYQMPAGIHSHVAWQIGHLAVAEYGLGLFRLRGRRDGDADLVTSSFRKQFSKGSKPETGDKYPTPAEIRGVLHGVHQQVLRELADYTEADLQEPVEEPHALFANKLGALFFCSLHEMMHAGQIGVLRLLLGKPPLR